MRLETDPSACESPLRVPALLIATPRCAIAAGLIKIYPLKCLFRARAFKGKIILETDFPIPEGGFGQ